MRSSWEETDMGASEAGGDVCPGCGEGGGSEARIRSEGWSP